MKNSSLSIILCVFALSGIGLAAATALDDGDNLVVASVNGEEITFGYIRESFGSRHSGHATMLAGEEIIRSVIDKAVDEELLVQEGRRMGVPDEEGFEEAVTAYRNTVLLEALESGMRHDSRPSEEEIDQAYELLPRQIRVRIMDVSDSTKADMAKMRLRGGEEFEAVAQQMSIHRSRTQGGDLGYVTWGTLDPTTEKVVFETPAGEVSDAFEQGSAYRILKVIEEKTGEPPPFDKMKMQILGILQARKLDVMRTDLLEEIARSHTPKEDHAAIEKLLASSPSPEPEQEGEREPPDDAVLMTTKTGLKVSATYVRQRASRARLSLAAAWEASRTDALLIDEARRSIRVDATMQSKIDLFTNLRIRAVVEQTAIMDNVTLSDEEVKAYYDENLDRLAGSASYQMRHIVLPTREEAQEVGGLLEGGADFGRLARKRSVDTKTASSGGDLGWVAATDFEEAGTVNEELFALRPGEFSDVIKTTLGYAIVQMMSVRPALTPPYEEARQTVASRLAKSKQDELRASFLEKLRAVAEIRLLQENISKAILLQDTLIATSLNPAEGE